MGVDEYKIESPKPSAYGNEAPIFFLLQAVARASAKVGRVVVTDSVAVYEDGEVVLFVGYPHTGKSTISVLALAKGLNVLSTENTVVEVKDSLRVVGGTEVLVYDPSVKHIYGVNVPHDSSTKSGYLIKDLKGEMRENILKKKPKVSKIVLLHAAFNCSGYSFSQMRGRKIKKTLWYFSTALLKGLDYYEPMPLHVPLNDKIKETLAKFLDVASSLDMIEAFGNHKSIFEALFGPVNEKV
ncbi:hypothetical protein Py04_0289 [Pyrococcus sp. ST04]|nr:hypothetical protein Py04_0289 [Pyrococcus sp. ST04]